MKKLFLISFVVLGILYAVALATLEKPGKPGLVSLRWATDPNPARAVQTSLFNRLNPALQLGVDPGLGGDQTKLIVQCATGTGPDLIDMDPLGMTELVQAGVLLDLTPYAQSGGFGPDQTYPAIGDLLTVEGHQYAFPCNVSANSVIYNRRLFDDHGVPYPKPGWTYDDFVATCHKLLAGPGKSGEKHLAVAHWYGTWFLEDLLMGHGGRLFRDHGLVSDLDSPESLAAMRHYYDLMFKEKVIPSAAQMAAMSAQGGWGSEGLTLFSSGRAAMIFIGRWYLVQAPNYPALKGNLGAVSLPRVGNLPAAGFAMTRAAGINAKSPHWKESLAFLKYLASPDYNACIARDGDSLPPNPKQAGDGKSLANDAVADPAFHQVFVDAIRSARPLDTSPFMDQSVVSRWLDEKVGIVENEIQSPEQAMKSLASEINATIRQDLERREDLQKKYKEATGKEYRADWWKT
jgi:multiple sugar transport system substrate-binding protein